MQLMNTEAPHRFAQIWVSEATGEWVVRGRRGGDGKIVVNIYARVLSGDLGTEAAMAALRAGCADATRATIAFRRADEDEWTVRYERTSGKLPGPFAI